MKRILYLSIIVVGLTGCAGVMDRISSMLEQPEKTEDLASEISKAAERYYKSLLGDKDVNTEISYQDFLVALQQQSQKEGLKVKNPSVDNIEFNVLAIRALEYSLYQIREKTYGYDLFKNPYQQKLDALYKTMSKVQYDICMFSLRKNKHKTENSFYENGAYCYSGYSLTYKEVSSLFVNPDRYFVIKWGHGTENISNKDSGLSAAKETIFDKPYLLFAK